MNPLNTVATAIVKANCLYSSPVIPPIKAVGINTANNTNTTPITGLVISSMAFSTASLRLYFPVSISRVEFSTTTIASSTTIAIAKTRPKRVSVLIENPINFITANVAISETGMVREGIIIALKFCKKIRMTSITIREVSTNVTNTSSIDALTN